MKVEIDTREMRDTLRRYIPYVKRNCAAELNQVALDITRDMWNALPPQNVAVKRSEVSNYLWAEMPEAMQRHRIIKSGPRKGVSVIVGRKKTRGKAGRRLYRIHLIVQARRRKEGKKGLYGEEMVRYAGAFAARAVRSVGYFKVVLLPIIRTLNPMVKFKMPFRETAGAGKISIWPGGRGYGFAKFATSNNPLAILNARWNFKGSRADYARSLVLNAFTRAWIAKIGKMQRAIARKLAKNNRYDLAA